MGEEKKTQEPFCEKASPKIEFIEITRWNHDNPNKSVRETKTAVIVEGLADTLITMKNPDYSAFGLLKSEFMRKGFNDAINEVLAMLGIEEQKTETDR